VENEAPALENPGRTEQTFEGHLAAPGKDGEAEPDTVSFLKTLSTPEM
jgi:hypothetical protein